MKPILLALLALCLISASAPAHLTGQIYPLSCQRPGYLNNPEPDLNGHELQVWIGGELVASDILFGREFITEDGNIINVWHNRFDVLVPAGFAYFVVDGTTWGAKVVKAGEDLTLNLCGQMPVVRIPTRHK